MCRGQEQGPGFRRIFAAAIRRSKGSNRRTLPILLVLPASHLEAEAGVAAAAVAAMGEIRASRRGILQGTRVLRAACLPGSSVVAHLALRAVVLHGLLAAAPQDLPAAALRGLLAAARNGLRSAALHGLLEEECHFRGTLQAQTTFGTGWDGCGKARDQRFSALL